MVTEGAARPSAPQQVGHVGDDGVLAEEQRALDEQRGLVVQGVLPPVPRQELREHDRHHLVVAVRLEMVQIERADEPTAVEATLEEVAR